MSNKINQPPIVTGRCPHCDKIVFLNNEDELLILGHGVDYWIKAERFALQSGYVYGFNDGE